MRHPLSQFPATLSAIVLAAACVRGVTRPHFGGTVQVEISSTVVSLDPAIPATNDTEAEGKQGLEEMLYDRLVRLDDNGAPLPLLATSWSHDADSKRWQFTLRANVKLTDGTLLAAEDAATSLAAVNSDWHVTASAGTVVIETTSPLPGLPAELALARNSIYRRGGDGILVGTGPFRLAEWQPGRRAVLAANDEYWGGRPYVDAVDIAMGRAPRDQLIDLELGRADVIELGIDQLRRASQENLRMIASPPSNLMALLFASGRPAGDNAPLREALALTIDRAAIHTILLQKQGALAGGLTPQWMSGYEFLFPATQDGARARKLLAGLASPPALTLSYDASDPVAHAVAERIALNARDAGLTVRVSALSSGSRDAQSDARLVRLPLVSLDLRTALAGLARELHEPVEQLHAESASPDELYAVEQSLLAEFRVIPLFHLPQILAVSPRLRDWTLSPVGEWHPEGAWVAVEGP